MISKFSSSPSRFRATPSARPPRAAPAPFRAPLPIGPRRHPLPPLEGVDEARRLRVAEALGDLVYGHPMREHLLGESLPDFVQQLPERGSFGGQMPVEGARRHAHLGSDAAHVRAAAWTEEVLPDALRDARAGSPPVEEIAALLLAQ